MSDLKPLICPRCGGTINRARMVCEYCGAAFDNGQTEMIEFFAYPAQTQILGAGVKVSRATITAMRRLHPDDWTQDIMEMLSREMAKKLIPFIEMDIHNNPADMTAEVHGRLRVLPPDYRF